MFNMPFKNGNTYANCFENEGIGIRQNYPFFDENRNEVVTLELAINECRKKNGEKINCQNTICCNLKELLRKF